MIVPKLAFCLLMWIEENGVCRNGDRNVHIGARYMYVLMVRGISLVSDFRVILVHTAVDNSRSKSEGLSSVARTWS